MKINPSFYHKDFLSTMSVDMHTGMNRSYVVKFWWIVGGWYGGFEHNVQTHIANPPCPRRVALIISDLIYSFG